MGKPSDDMPVEERFEPDYSDLEDKEEINFGIDNATTMKVTALGLAVEARIVGSGADEIVRTAERFEQYLTGNNA